MIKNKEQLTKNQALERVHGIVSLVYFLYLVVITMFIRIFLAMFVLDMFFELVLKFYLTMGYFSYIQNTILQIVC